MVYYNYFSTKWSCEVNFFISWINDWILKLLFLSLLRSQRSYTKCCVSASLGRYQFLIYCEANGVRDSEAKNWSEIFLQMVLTTEKNDQRQFLTLKSGLEALLFSLNLRAKENVGIKTETRQQPKESQKMREDQQKGSNAEDVHIRSDFRELVSEERLAVDILLEFVDNVNFETESDGYTLEPGLVHELCDELIAT